MHHNWEKGDKRRTDRFPLIASYECGTAAPKVPDVVEELIASDLSAETVTVELLYTNFVSLVKARFKTPSDKVAGRQGICYEC